MIQEATKEADYGPVGRIQKSEGYKRVKDTKVGGCQLVYSRQPQTSLCCAACQCWHTVSVTVKWIQSGAVIFKNIIIR